jgi:DNA-binding MarR family transcriptional regulator
MIDSDVLGGHVARLVDATIRHRAVIAAQAGLTLTDVSAVSLLLRAGELRPGDLSDGLRLSPSGATNLIHRLVAVGLADRDGGPGNHRNVRVRLTLTGRELAAMPPAARHAVDEMGPAARAGFAELLARLADAVERDAEALVRVTTAARKAEFALPPRWG